MASSRIAERISFTKMRGEGNFKYQRLLFWLFKKLLMIQVSCSKCDYSFYCHNNALQCHAAFCCFIVYFCYIECYTECYIFTVTLNDKTRLLLGRSQRTERPRRCQDAAPCSAAPRSAGPCADPPVLSPFPLVPGPLIAVPVTSFYPL